jgi:hypothetical protein
MVAVSGGAARHAAASAASSIVAPGCSSRIRACNHHRQLERVLEADLRQVVRPGLGRE